MFDLLIGLGVLALLAIPVIAIVALVTAVESRGLARRLDLRLGLLERSLALGAAPGAAAPSPPPQPQPAPEPAPPPPLPSGAAELPPQPPPLPPQPPQPTSVPPTPAPGPLPPRQIGFEERVGTRWLARIGGVALALGGVFLVRYSIEQGLIGPGVRIVLGGLLALILIAVGEWTRRSQRLSAVPGLPSADIPSILTAAGTTVAYATVYAAYGLYGFLPPAIAFVLLGAVALLTLAAALLHGPALAGLGLIGAFLAPMLVASDHPDYWALYIYIAVVTAAAFALARFRLWRWLAITAIVFSALWMLPGIDLDEALNAHVFYVLVGFALSAILLVCGLLYGPSATPGEVEHLSSLALSVYLLLAAILVLSSHHEAVPLAAFVVLTIAGLAIAWRAEAATAAVPVAAVLAVVVMGDWAVQMNLSKLVAPSGPTAPAIPEPERYFYGSHLLLAGGWAALFGIGGFLAQGRSVRAFAPMLWAASAVFTPLGILIALYYRVAGLDQSLPFAGFALLLAAIFGVATETLVNREARPGLMAASAMFATGGLAALALALTFALEKGWLTVGLALMSPAAAWIAEKRPLPWLRWLSAIMVAIVVARVGYEPRIVGGNIGSTPIFNWLLYGYGIPTASFWVAGWQLRRRADDLPARMVDAGAILFTVLLAILEIRHYVTRGDVYRPAGDILENMLYVNVGLALTVGLERVRGRTGSVVHNVGALIVAALTLLTILIELAIALGPRFYNHPVGGEFFNLILLGYGLPAVLAFVLASIARTTRPMAYRIFAVITAVTLVLFYLTLEVRRLFHGPVLAGTVGDAEQYSYSTAWLLFGIALLAAGAFLRSEPARLAALAVIAATIAKVFILDTASIAGIYRALSVIGLGVVLLGIGWLYQKAIYPRTRQTPAPSS